MARFSEVSEFFDPGLTVTVLGVEYTLPLPSTDLGLWLTTIIQAAPAAKAIAETGTADQMESLLDQMRELPQPEELRGRTLEQAVLGEALDQMRANGVPYHMVQHVFRTAIWWIVVGEQAAEQYWTSGGRPPVLGPAANRQARRARTGSSSRTTNTGEAAMTPRRASGSGTSSRRSGSRRTGTRSRGSRS